MRVDIRVHDIDCTDALRQHLERRLRFALGRFDGRVLRVTARLADVNGPRGGADKRCQLRALLRPAAQVVVDDTDADLYAAIDRATERMGRAVTRAVQRARAMAAPATRRAPDWSAL